MRNAVIEGNEFVYTGDSAILSIGTAELIDGTDGNQPSPMCFLRNHADINVSVGLQVTKLFSSLTHLRQPQFCWVLFRKCALSRQCTLTSALMNSYVIDFETSVLH